MKLLGIVGLGLCLSVVACGSSAAPSDPSPQTVARASAPLGNADNGPYCDGHLPNTDFTTGSLCAETDDHFDGFRYPEQVAHCARHVTSGMKAQVAAFYGIAPADYSKYEFDHFVPLAIGGSSDLTNLWPQPIEEALEKDQLEQALYYKIKKGSITQDDAVAQIWAWRPSSGLADACQ